MLLLKKKKKKIRLRKNAVWVTAYINSQNRYCWIHYSRRRQSALIHLHARESLHHPLSFLFFSFFPNGCIFDLVFFEGLVSFFEQITPSHNHVAEFSQHWGSSLRYWGNHPLSFLVFLSSQTAGFSIWFSLKGGVFHITVWQNFHLHWGLFILYRGNYPFSFLFFLSSQTAGFSIWFSLKGCVFHITVWQNFHNIEVPLYVTWAITLFLNT